MLFRSLLVVFVCMMHVSFLDACFLLVIEYCDSLICGEVLCFLEGVLFSMIHVSLTFPLFLMCSMMIWFLDE